MNANGVLALIYRHRLCLSPLYRYVSTFLLSHISLRMRGIVSAVVTLFLRRYDVCCYCIYLLHLLQTQTNLYYWSEAAKYDSSLIKLLLINCV